MDAAPCSELRGGRLPARLADLPRPPRILYVRGELPRGPAVAIIGTRHPSPRAAGYARAIAAELARAGIAVLSGGAKGIDTAAHRGALSAGGCTVVVAPCGFERPFPSENAELFASIVSSGGSYVSLVADDVPAAPHLFFPRNACLVALAHAVVVVEAPFRSGARNAAKHARRIGRPLYVVPAAPWNPRGAGCVLELELGARPFVSARRLRRDLGRAGHHAVSLPAQLPRTTMPKISEFLGPSTSAEEIGSVLLAVQNGAQYPDAVCVATGLSAARVQELLLTLTLRGALVADSSGRLKPLNI